MGEVDVVSVLDLDADVILAALADAAKSTTGAARTLDLALEEHEQTGDVGVVVRLAAKRWLDDAAP